MLLLFLLLFSLGVYMWELGRGGGGGGRGGGGARNGSRGGCGTERGISPSSVEFHNGHPSQEGDLFILGFGKRFMAKYIWRFHRFAFGRGRVRDYGRKSGLYGQEKASISSCGVLFVTRPHITLFFGESPPVLRGRHKILS